MHDEVVDPVLNERRWVRRVEESFVVRVVFGEQQGRRAVAIEMPLRPIFFCNSNYRGLCFIGFKAGARVVASPRPAVPEPKRRQQVKFRGVWAAIVGGDLDQNVLGRFLRVFDEHIKVPVLIKYPGVNQFILELVAAAGAIGFEQLSVGKGGLRIFVEILHVGVSGRAIEVEVIFLHVFAVIALAVGQPEEAFFYDRIFSIPERECEAEPLPIIGDSGQTILSPVIGPRPRLVVREVIPGVSVITVILANCPPLPFTEIGAPFLPWGPGIAGFFEALFFELHSSRILAIENGARALSILACAEKLKRLKQGAQQRANVRFWLLRYKLKT